MIFDDRSGKLLLIAGPCSLESRELALEIAGRIAELAEARKGELTAVFKGSFDKANRTSISSPRGPGMEAGCEIFAEVKKRFGLACITDVHETWQCAIAAQVCDALQIPAFLCRQTDLLAAAAKTGRAVNVKKGQFLSPADMRYAVGKLRESGAEEIWQTERGSTFGYGNLVVDMRSFAIMAANGAPVIFDATHSVQLPGAATGASGGERQYERPLAMAAIAAGADGLFIETHPDPENAISDSATQLPLDDLEGLVDEALDFFKTAQKRGRQKILRA